MILTPRLKKITECIPRCRTLADIGTDHGYIPIYCAENSLCEKAVACDVNSGPLSAASENIAAAGLSEKIGTRLSDGLEGLSPHEADVIVIAGMGGFLIRDILIRGADRIDQNTTLILQPMVAIAELREYLYTNGYEIFDEKLAREESKFYNILCVRRGECEFTKKDILAGKNISHDENYEDYIRFHVKVLEKILAGLEKSSGKEKETEEIKEKIRIIKG